jgi:hypothetical protein
MSKVGVWQRVLDVPIRRASAIFRSPELDALALVRR